MSPVTAAHSSDQSDLEPTAGMLSLGLEGADGDLENRGALVVHSLGCLEMRRPSGTAFSKAPLRSTRGAVIIAYAQNSPTEEKKPSRVGETAAFLTTLTPGWLSTLAIVPAARVVDRTVSPARIKPFLTESS